MNANSIDLTPTIGYSSVGTRICIAPRNRRTTASPRRSHIFSTPNEFSHRCPNDTGVPDIRPPASIAALTCLYVIVAVVVAIALLVHRIYWAGLDASLTAVLWLLTIGIGTSWIPLAAGVLIWALLKTSEGYTRR